MLSSPFSEKDNSKFFKIKYLIGLEIIIAYITRQYIKRVIFQFIFRIIINMFQNDPIKHAEKIVREAHDGAGKYTKPVLRRYPLLFSFLVVFSVAAIVHGFELLTDEFEFFKQYPSSLILMGIFLLFITGMLYKSLDKMK